MRTTEDPGHVFLYSSNNCSGHYFGEKSEENSDFYINNFQSLGSIWVNRSTFFQLEDNNIMAKSTWGLTDEYEGRCVSANSWEEEGLTYVAYIYPLAFYFFWW